MFENRLLRRKCGSKKEAAEDFIKTSEVEVFWVATLCSVASL
jgi:hypothetical protein